MSLNTNCFKLIKKTELEKIEDSKSVEKFNLYFFDITKII